MYIVEVQAWRLATSESVGLSFDGYHACPTGYYHALSSNGEGREMKGAAGQLYVFTIKLVLTSEHDSFEVKSRPAR